MTSGRSTVLASIAITLVAAASAAQAPQFRYERPVVADRAGPYRLPVDAPLVLGAARVPTNEHEAATGASPHRAIPRHGLRDLRLLDASNREVPYLLVWSDADVPVMVQGTVLPITTTQKTSGFEADLGMSQVVDMITVAGLPAPFLKRLVLEGSGDRRHWTILLAEGTLFDLPAEKLQQHQLQFRAGPYRFLRVTWDDRNSGPPGVGPMRPLRRSSSAHEPARSKSSAQ